MFLFGIRPIDVSLLHIPFFFSCRPTVVHNIHCRVSRYISYGDFVIHQIAYQSYIEDTLSVR